MGSGSSCQRADLGGAAWAKIADLLPTNVRWGGRLREHRGAVGGILWKPALNI